MEIVENVVKMYLENSSKPFNITFIWKKTEGKA